MSASWTREFQEGPRCPTGPVYCDNIPEDDWCNLANLGLLVHYVLLKVECESANFVALALCVAFG